MSRKRDERITDVAFDPTGRFLAIPGECGVQILALYSPDRCFAEIAVFELPIRTSVV